MIPFFIGAIIGGFVCIAYHLRSSFRVFRSSTCAEAYEAGKRDGWKQTCMRLRTDCPAYERFIERGE
jgi:hypothetical protein